MEFCSGRNRDTEMVTDVAQTHFTAQFTAAGLTLPRSLVERLWRSWFVDLIEATEEWRPFDPLAYRRYH
jgi:hypothetical protein